MQTISGRSGTVNPSIRPTGATLVSHGRIFRPITAVKPRPRAGQASLMPPRSDTTGHSFFDARPVTPREHVPSQGRVPGCLYRARSTHRSITDQCPEIGCQSKGGRWNATQPYGAETSMIRTSGRGSDVVVHGVTRAPRLRSGWRLPTRPNLDFDRPPDERRHAEYATRVYSPASSSARSKRSTLASISPS